MARHGRVLPGLAPVLLLLLLNAGCSGANLGDMDESANPRDDMPGPGIFADDQGETTLKWSSDSKQAEAEPEPELAQSSPDSTMSPEQAEFEQYKAWNELKGKGAESAEYQEFLQWLEYQKFKSNQ
ncbi:MAG: hypothetical protein GY875_02330 [Gammaproteobacteria bacterium]|nr:hypothetical protein [Gammaproteobacteria bacterium]